MGSTYFGESSSGSIHSHTFQAQWSSSDNSCLRAAAAAGSNAASTSETGDAESSKKPHSSKYKGVVPQPNGRWGAQIYDKHRRVWIGTFNLEEQAAAAYDVAARRFRGSDATTNLHFLENTAEMAFLKSHSKAEIVDMLRKHTYADELHESTNKYERTCACMNNNNIMNVNDERSFVSAGNSGRREVLFEKALTPSDVGKLNRMVIPKQHAEKHFPLPAEGASSGALLIFEDETGKAWRFRYCYWSSSQSYVLTKGWSYFVKEKKLMTGDVVRFWRSSGPEKKLFIERRKENESGSMEIVEDDRGIDPLREVRLFGVNIKLDQTQWFMYD